MSRASRWKNKRKRCKTETPQNNSQSSTLGSRARISEKILKDKSKTCKNIAHNIKSFMTSLADSISTEKAYKGFYDTYVETVSKKLWLPTETDSLELLTNSSRQFFNCTEQKSWFSIKTIKRPNWEENKKLWKMSLPSIPFLLPDCKAHELPKTDVNEQNETATNRKRKRLLNKEAKGHKLTRPELVFLGRLQMKTFPVRLYFDTEQKQTLAQWFGIARMVYNYVISFYRGHNYKPTIQHVRQWWEEETLSKPYIAQCPYNIKDESARQAFTSIEGGHSRVLSGKERGGLSFRTKKDLLQVMRIRAQNINFLNYQLYSTILFKGKRHVLPHQKLKKTNIKTSLQDGEEWSDCILQYHRKLGHYKLYVTYTLPVQVHDKKVDGHQVVALDPGVKTFLTGYSPTLNIAFKIAQGDYNRLRRLSISYYKIRSLLDRLSGKDRRKKKCHLSKVLHRILFRIQNLKREVHYKTASWLTSTFDIIFLPPFNQNNCMTKKQQKKWTHKETRKDILNWSHGAFRKILLYLAKQRNCQVVLLGEQYTTKTCTNCGWLNDRVGASDVFQCKNTQCQVYAIDRDLNGARNIFLKFLKESKGTMEYFDTVQGTWSAPVRALPDSAVPLFTEEMMISDLSETM